MHAILFEDSYLCINAGHIDDTRIKSIYLFSDLCFTVCGLIFPVSAVHGRGAVRHIDQCSLDVLSDPMTEPGHCAIHPYTLSLSQQGVWAIIWTPKPSKFTPLYTQKVM